MRTSQFFFSTLKEAPADAEVVSQKLMVRAGYIKKQAAGIYTWMPLGLRVLRKVENIVREEMNRTGALELVMPVVQSAELWQESKRWSKYGPELLRLQDRHQRDFVLGPTAEEVVTDVVRRDVKSYRQLPLCFYQIQTKFRDEIRPRFGVMRGREFVMKDAYSFHPDYADLQREYQVMYDAYSRIFSRMGLSFRAVAADTGSIGGTGSHEFHVLADSGEDAIAYCPQSDYAANVELAPTLPIKTPRPAAHEELQKMATPCSGTCQAVADFLQVDLSRIVKSIAVVPCDDNDGSESADTGAGSKKMALLLLSAEHSLNEIKVSKLPGWKNFRFAHDSEVREFLGAPPGFIGPVGIDTARVQVFADYAVAAKADFICGGNEADTHYCGVNFGRDVPEPEWVDIRNVVAGDPSPDGKGELQICRGVEVGHIFQLRRTYTEALQCTYLDEGGRSQVMEMGCYGIGVTRVVAAAIEQGNDDKGMILPAAIAPFAICIVPMGYHKSETVKATADALHAELTAYGFEVLLDDRNERPGSMFADMELIGIPHRFVVGEKTLAVGKVEYKGRQSSDIELVDREQVLDFCKRILSA